MAGGLSSAIRNLLLFFIMLILIDIAVVLGVDMSGLIMSPETASSLILIVVAGTLISEWSDSS